MENLQEVQIRVSSFYSCGCCSDSEVITLMVVDPFDYEQVFSAINEYSLFSASRTDPAHELRMNPNFGVDNYLWLLEDDNYSEYNEDGMCFE